jgi:hypothetical protein
MQHVLMYVCIHIDFCLTQFQLVVNKNIYKRCDVEVPAGLVMFFFNKCSFVAYIFIA